MGNQTLVPSQIQSVESYFLDLKTYIQFKSSLGSTTFMKTAKVNLVETMNDVDLILLESAYRNLSFVADTTYNNYPSSPNSSSTLSPNLGINSSTNQVNSNTSNSNQLNQTALSTSPSQAQSIQQAIQNRSSQQIFKQKVQALRELQQVVVVKIFPKYDLSIRFDLYSKRVKEIKNIIYSRYGPSTNCLPFADLVITDRAAFLFRQYIKYNLYDRLSTRPFLTLIEKKWIAYQLLSAVNEIHSLQIVHGDMKIENVLINSFLWVSLTDFASYKPVYLSKNHPSADFNYYFDISRRRTCYLATERLDPSPNLNRCTSPTSNDDHQSSTMYELKPPDPSDFRPSMDIFSLGCLLAELFMERPLFDFAQLLAYRDRKYDPTQELLSEIHDKNILNMILSMISLNPSDRKTINEYLVEQNDQAFPSYFVYLKSYLSGFINAKLTADEIVIKLKNDLPILLKNFKLNLNNQNTSASMTKSGIVNNNNEQQNDAFFILLSLLLSCIRKIKFADNKLIVVNLMSTFSKFLDDSIVLDRCVPYYLWMLEQKSEAPIVKSHVIYALNDCLSNIYKIDLNNLNIFTVMIFDCLEKLSSGEQSFLIRASIAKTIAQFALTSLRYLDMSFLTRRQAALAQSNITNNNTSNQDLSCSSTNLDQNLDIKLLPNYDTEYEDYQARVKAIVMNLITESSQSNSSNVNAVKETLLRSDISKLCTFFGRQNTSIILLPHLATLLNEKTDWSIRAAFFDALCPILSCVGWESVDIVKSLLEQGLRDSEEFVIYRTLLCLCKMIEVGLFDKQQICHFLSLYVIPLLCHPSLWIRHGAVAYVASICRASKSNKLSNSTSDCGGGSGALNTVDILCSVIPLLNKFLLKNKDMLIQLFDREEILFQCLKKPISRVVLDLISQDGRYDQLLVYLTQRAEIRCLNIFNTQNFLPSYIDCSDSSVQELFEKLCNCGLVEEDEDKLLQMKDFLEKTRISRLSSSLYNNNNNNNNNQIMTSGDLMSASNTSMNKDGGYINIMKERFQRVQCVYLKNRPNFVPVVSQQQQQQNQTPISQSPILDQSNRRGEMSTEERLVAQLQQQQFMLRNNNYNNRANSLKFYSDCTLEVEKYLSRSKMIYDKDCSNQYRALKFRETINSSFSASNSICLLSSMNKWKPKGHLVLNSNEHTREINKISRNFDSSFFSTCSSMESCVKIWSTESLFDAKSGFYKSIFTFDRQNNNQNNAPSSTNSSDNVAQQPTSVLNSYSMEGLFRPCCTAFYNKNSLAILCEDYRFYAIDFDANRNNYRLLSNEKLFKQNQCKNLICSCNPSYNLASYPKTVFYYTNKLQQQLSGLKQRQQQIISSSCVCNLNYPIEMIHIDDQNPMLYAMNTNLIDYFYGARSSSNVRGLFAYSTSYGDLSCVDMRSLGKAFDVKRDLKQGYITTMCTDPWNTWLACGTSTGQVEVYDFRFMLPVQTFEHRSRTSVVKLANHPRLNSRLVATYQANNEIAVWNMENNTNSNNQPGKSSNKPDLVFWGVQNVPPLCQNRISNHYISGLVAVGSSGDDYSTNGLLCASTDMKIRYIDLNESNSYRDSYIVSSAFNFQQNGNVVAGGGGSAAAGATSASTSATSAQASCLNSNKNSEFASSSIMGQSVSFETRQIEGTRVLLELDSNSNNNAGNASNSSSSSGGSYSMPALTHQSYFTHHQDAITDLLVCYNSNKSSSSVSVSSKNQQPLFITSSRDGCLKIWK
jgi:phosphoinositide-3-kinase regulatory subunit 4